MPVNSIKSKEWKTWPQADGVSDKGFHLKAVASVTLDSVFTCDGLAGEKTWHDVSNPPLRLVATEYETHWWESESSSVGPAISIFLRP